MSRGGRRSASGTDGGGGGSGAGGGETDDGPPPSSTSNDAKNTVFVRFVPPDSAVTRLSIENHFGTIGPIKKCSVIREKKKRKRKKEDDGDGGEEEDDAKKKNREGLGYGFVRYVSEADARAAAATFDDGTMEIDGRTYRLFVKLAGGSDAGGGGGKRDGKKRRPSKSSPATTEEGGDNGGGGGGGKKAEEEKEKEQQREDYETISKRKRTSRVVVHNLSFYATERNVKAEMERRFGPVHDVHLPLVPSAVASDEGDDGKRRRGETTTRHRGFAFITFRDATSAKKAVEGGGDGDVIIRKRPVAIDFAVSKATHARMKREEEEAKRRGDDDDGDDDEEGAERAHEERREAGDDGDGDDDDGSSDDDGGSSDDDGGSSDDDGGSTDSSEPRQSEDDDDDDESSERAEKPPPPSAEDDEALSAGRTLFVRNVPFDASRHDLFLAFAAHGRIRSAYLVKDKETRTTNRGTAFVTYEDATGSKRALEAAGGSEGGDAGFASQKDGAATAAGAGSGGVGIYLRGRRLLVDPAVDRVTASSLTSKRDDAGEGGEDPAETERGKDRRNLYLVDEGRVASGGGDDDDDAWENLPESDKLKRQRAHRDNLTKLKSPLFYVNPHRLSIRNVAKRVDDKRLKELVATALRRGLDSNLVEKNDATSHWRASGAASSTREVLSKLAEVERSYDGKIVPPFDERNVKECVASVRIVRDVDSVATKSNSKPSDGAAAVAPSRGFGFAEFRHHEHALACLRELNNNPRYSAEYAAGGKKAIELRERATASKKKRKKKKKKRRGGDTDAEDEDDDGVVRIPRLIVEFTVENKAKAKKSSEKKERRLADVRSRRAAARKERRRRAAGRQKGKGGGGAKRRGDSDDDEEKTTTKKMGRGAAQRERKRRRREEAEEAAAGGGKRGGVDDGGDGGAAESSTIATKEEARRGEERATRREEEEGVDVDDSAPSSKKKKKKKKPPKKKRKVDEEERNFEDLVRSYKAAFGGIGEGGKKNDDKNRKTDGDANEAKGHPRERVVEKRWFE